jgi:hypothetical protein
MTNLDNGLVGAWLAHLTFTAGPRQGERERLRMTFLPDGVIVGVSAIRAHRGEVPPASGEWTANGDCFSYWLNAVISDVSGRPRRVVYGHARGTLAGDGQSLTASGGSEVYGNNGQLLATNQAELHATRAEAP